MVISSSNPHNRELAIRKRIASIYNKREEDFPSLKEYNDYLEEVEDMIFNLVEGINVHEFEEKIQEYQKENAEQIMINQARKAEELAAALAASKGISAQDDPNGDPNQSALGGIGVGTQGQYVPTLAGGQPRPSGIPQPIPHAGGMDLQSYDNEEMMKLRVERGGRAGGFSIELSKKRALEEAFASIWI